MSDLGTIAIIRTGASTAVFAAVFLFGGRIRPLGGLPFNRQYLLSFSAGISLSYVFVRLMPELAGARLRLVAATSLPTRFNGMIVYFAALVGFLAFFALEHVHRKMLRGAEESQASGFDPQILGYMAYTCLIAYLLVDNLDNSALASAAYVVAMAVHFLNIDHRFRAEPGDRYDRRGHLLLAASPFVGWGLGLLIVLPRDVLALMLAFLSGGVIVNSMVNELPSGRKGTVLPLAIGSILYSAVLIPLG